MVRPLLVANFADVVGGGELSLVELAEELATRGARPLLAVPGRGTVGTGQNGGGLDRVLVPRSIPGMAAAFQRLAREVDLIHLTGARGLMAAGIARAGKPLVWHARVADRDKLDLVLARVPDIIIANSRATAARFGDAPNVRVIPNGVRPPAVPDRRLNLTPGMKHIGVIARMTPEKGHDDLLPVIESFLAERADCEWICVGDDRGPIGDAYRKAAESQPRLRLLGPIERAVDHFAELDLIVVPSRVEGFGRVAAEALMAGVPVLARRIGGLIETLAEAPNAFLPENPDQWSARISETLAHPPSAEALRAAGEAFTIEKHVDRVMEVYREVAAK
jgi:glycosyltransferase involved in cell wall biosynthesis